MYVKGKNMKIVQINCVYGTASTGRIVKGIEECARASGLECIAAYSQGTADDREAFRFGSIVEQKVHALLSRLTGLQGYFSYFGTRELLKKLDNMKPDVVHLHNLHSNNINLKMLLHYLAKHNITTILTLHDCWFFTGKCCHFTMAGCEGWKTGCNNCPNLKEDNKSLFFDRSGKMQRDKQKWFANIPHLFVVGVSEWVTELAKESAVLSGAEKFQVIHNGIDLEAFQPRDSDLRQKLGLEGQFIALGLAMGMSRRKGSYDFFKMAEMLPEGVTLVLAGLTQEQIKSLPGNIIGINRTNDVTQLSKVYSMADVFLNPSYEDTFGLVNAEALACGTPVITYRTGGCTEIVDETCGIVVECGDTLAMLAAVEHMKEEIFPAAACRKRAQMFAQQERYHDYVTLYQETVGDK